MTRQRKPFSIQEDFATIDDHVVRHEFERRMITLEDAARARNFAIRDDSTLIWNYCTGTLPTFWTAHGVIDELFGTDALHRHTNYTAVLELALRHIANEMKATYQIHWDQVWYFCRTYATEAVKAEVLRRAGVAFGDEPCSEC